MNTRHCLTLWTVLVIGLSTSGVEAYQRSNNSSLLVSFDSDVVFADDTVALFVSSSLPASDVLVHSPELGWDWVELAYVDGHQNRDWEVILATPEGAQSGRYQILVAAVDQRGQYHEQRIPLFVLERE